MTRDDIVPAALWTYGVMQLGQGLWMLVSPGSFFDLVGPFGPRNDHYTRDAATWSIALGGVLVFAALRGNQGARALVLLLAGFQAAMHTVNHVADAGIADPGWVGVFDAIALAAITVALLVVWRRADASTQPTPAPAGAQPLKKVSP